MFEEWQDSPVTRYILAEYVDRKDYINTRLASVGHNLVITEEMNAERLKLLGSLDAYEDILNIQFDDLEEEA